MPRADVSSSLHPEYMNMGSEELRVPEGSDLHSDSTKWLQSLTPVITSLALSPFVLSSVDAKAKANFTRTLCIGESEEKE